LEDGHQLLARVLVDVVDLVLEPLAMDAIVCWEPGAGSADGLAIWHCGFMREGCLTCGPGASPGHGARLRAGEPLCLKLGFEGSNLLMSSVIAKVVY
jgi:hypothetical protein